MAFEQIWQQLCRKQPNLLNPTEPFTMTSLNLKLLLEQVYEQGKQANTSIDIDRTFLRELGQ